MPPAVMTQLETARDLPAPLPRPRSMTRIVLVISTVFIYLQVFALPWTPRVASGDQAIYLHHATRMLQGDLIYRDYDHFTPPGTDVVYTMLFKSFGVRAWIPQAMLVALGTCMVWLIVLIGEKLGCGAMSYLSGLLFATLPFSSYLDATHHWYSLVPAVGALLVLLENRSFPRIFWAGVLVGAATFFTQSMALLVVGFSLFLLWEARGQSETWAVLLKKEVSLFVGFLGTISLCMFYFVWMVGLKKIVYYTFIFVVRYYSADWFNNWHVYLTGHPQRHVWTTWLDLPAFILLHALVPLVYVLCLGLCAFRWRLRSDELRTRVILISVTGLFLFLTVSSAPAFSRLYAVSPPALVLLVWILTTLATRARVGVGLAWIAVCFSLIARPVVFQTRSKQFLDLPTGRTAFVEPLLYEKCKWMSERSRPLDYFFGDHLVAFTLRLRNAGRVPFLRPTEYTRPEEVANAVAGLERFRVQYVSWYAGLDRSTDALRHPEGDHLEPLRLYLREHYHVAQTFSNGDKIWERNH